MKTSVAYKRVARITGFAGQIRRKESAKMEKAENMQRRKLMTTKVFICALLAMTVLVITIPFAEATSVTVDQALAWVESLLGQAYDYDGVYGAQCVDLVFGYYNHLGVPVSWGNGCDFASNTLPSGWSRVAGGSPQPGDICVFNGSSDNPAGHVCIYGYNNTQYHGRFNGNGIVQKTNSNIYAYSNSYWGYIRPNWPSPDNAAPVIVSAEATNITYTGFDVVCHITDNIGVTRVSFAVWNGGNTSSDQDDIQWYDITSLTSGNAKDGTWKCHVDISNHGNDYVSPYNVDVRAYDAAGNVNNPYTHLDGIRVKQPINSINLSFYPIDLKRGETQKLTVTTDPADYDQSKLVWTSSNSAMVSVDNSGLVTAHHMSDGYVSITCSSPDGSISDSVNVYVYSNLSSNSAFYVDRVPASLTDGTTGYYGLVALIREPGDMLECTAGISFDNDAQSYDLEYRVEQGDIILSNNTLFIGKNTSTKNVIAAYVYDKYDDGTRGPEMERAKITIFKDSGGGTFTLPANLNQIEENAFDGVAATKYFIPSSLTTLTANSLAGIPHGSWIFFNSDTVNLFYDFDVLGLPESEARSEDYYWFDTGSMKMEYFYGDGGTANYYCLVGQAEYRWSDWTTATPAGGTEYESKTQYRGRSVSSQTVYSDWGSWVSNGTTAIDSNDLRDVRTIPHAAQTKTVYTYDHYKYYNTSNNNWYFSYADTSGNSWSSQGRWEYAESDTPYSQYKWASSDGYDGWRDGSSTPWFHQGTKQVTISNAYTEYQYRTRTTSQENIYGEWSDWSDNTLTPTDSLEVETRTLYRTKEYY